MATILGGNRSSEDWRLGYRWKLCGAALWREPIQQFGEGLKGMAVREQRRARDSAATNFARRDATRDLLLHGRLSHLSIFCYLILP